MLFHIAFIVVYILLSTVLDLDPVILDVTLIVQCGLSLFSAINKKVNLFKPLNVFYISSIIICLGNITAANVVAGEKNINSYMIKEYVPDATLIWCVGVSLIFIGYEFFATRTLPSLRLDITDKTAKKLYYFIFFISAFSYSINDYLSFLGSISKLLFLFGPMGIMFYARLGASRNDKKYMKYAIILFVVQTYIAVMNAYLRYELLLPSVVLFAGYFVGKGHVKALLSYRIIPFVIIFGVFISAFGSLGKHRSNFGAVLSQEYLSDAPQAEDLDIYDEDKEKSGNFFERSACVAQLSNVVKLTKDHGFYEGVVSLPLVFALVPRLFWPDKPLVQQGQWFAVEIGTAFYTNGHANNSINMTVMGELYLDFGWVGVVIGCILFGGMIRILWNCVQYDDSPYNILGILFGGYILLLCFGIASDLQIVITYASTYVLLFITKKIVVDYF